MKGVVAAPLAVFLVLDAIRIILLVLRRGVITTLAVSACQCDLSAHLCSFLISFMQAANRRHEPYSDT